MMPRMLIYDKDLRKAEGKLLADCDNNARNGGTVKICLYFFPGAGSRPR